MRCEQCVNRTEFGAERFGKYGHYAAHARCFVWGHECQAESCGCRFYETDPAKAVADTNAPWYKMQKNVHDYHPSWGTCRILTAYAKGDWYAGHEFDIRCSCGAYCQPHWWGGVVYKSEIEAINAELDILIRYVERDRMADIVIPFLKNCKMESRQLTLF